MSLMTVIFMVFMRILRTGECCDVRDVCVVLDDQDDFDGGGAHVILDDRGVLEPLFIVMSLCLCNVP